MNIAVSQIERQKTGNKSGAIYLAVSLCMHVLMACGLIQIKSLNIVPSQPVTITFALEQPAPSALQTKPKPQIVSQAPLQPSKNLHEQQASRMHLKALTNLHEQVIPVPNKQLSAPINRPIPATKTLQQPTLRIPENTIKPAPIFPAQSAVSETASEKHSETIATVPANSSISTAIETSKKVPSAAKATWQGLLLGRLERYKRYPKAARELHQEGTAYLRFSMNREGKILSAHLQKSAGSNLLDEETLTMIRRAEPLPTPPSDVSGNIIELVVPVQFSLKK